MSRNTVYMGLPAKVDPVLYRGLVELADGLELACRIERLADDSGQGLSRFVATGRSAAALGEFAGAARRLAPQLTSSLGGQASLRPLAELRGRDLARGDYRRELDTLMTGLLYRAQWPQQGTPDYWAREDGLRKAHRFLSDTRVLVGLFHEAANPLTRALTLDGSLRVGVGRQIGPRLANDNQTDPVLEAADLARMQQGLKALRMLDLYADALKPLLVAHDGNPRDGQGLLDACELMRNTTSRIERIRFLHRVMPTLVPTASELRQGYPRGHMHAPERHWVFDVKLLVSQGRIDDALARLAAVPLTPAARGRRNTWFEAAHPYLSTAIQHLATGEPTWNSNHQMWNQVVVNRGTSGNPGRDTHHCPDVTPVCTPALWRALDAPGLTTLPAPPR